ncbi:MAG: glycosyltransferase family 4 protein [Aquificaceae bacterium]
MGISVKKLILTSNTSWSVWNFRRGLIRALIDKGFDVYVVAPEDEYSKNFPKFIPLKNLDRKGKNPIRDAKLLLEYISIYRRIKPDLVLNFTIKPNIYSSLACRLLSIRCISTITGLGYVFVKESLLTKFVSLLYKVSLEKNQKVVFLNPDDKELFLKRGLINEEKAVIIKGEGINTELFNPKVCQKKEKDAFIFLMVSRLLWDKGVGEFVSAGRLLKEAYKENIELWLLGPIDKGNPSSVSEEDIKRWEEEGIIKYLGTTQDVRPFICQADCVVLPSYREGIPRSLLEAMAMERPIITTDSPGCREVCKDGENGFLVKPRDVESLFRAMERMYRLSGEERESMGRLGRKLAVDEFSEEKVIRDYLEIIFKEGG